MKTEFVKPKEGMQIRKPDNGQPLSPEGEDVVFTSYWRRRLRDGDIEVLDEKATAAARKAIETKRKAEAKKAEAEAETK